MQSFFSTLRKRVAALVSSGAPGRTPYDAELQRRLQTLATSLQRQLRKNKEASAMLAELLKPLAELAWEGTTHTGRTLLVQVGDLLLSALQALSPAERFNYYKGVVLVLRRLEYGGQLMVAALPGAPPPSSDEYTACVRYRSFMAHVLAYAQGALQQQIATAPQPPTVAEKPAAETPVLGPDGEPLPGPPAGADDPVKKLLGGELQPALNAVFAPPFVVVSFCAQVLALLMFRMPVVLDAMMHHVLAVSPDDLQACLAALAQAENQLDAQLRAQERLEEEDHLAGRRSQSNVDPSSSSPAARPSPRRTLSDNRHSALSVVGGHGHTGIGKGDVVRRGRGISASGATAPTPAVGEHDASWFFLQPFDESLQACPAVPAEWQEGMKLLTDWNVWHARLPAAERPVDVRWLTRDLLGRNTSFLQLTVKFWIEHAQSVLSFSGTGQRGAPFRCLPAFRSMVRLIMLAFVELPAQRAGPLKEAVIAVLGVEPSLTSYFLKALFLSTDGGDFLAVLDALLQVESWFKHIASIDDGNGTLPETFDYDFMCQGFDQILALDHHVVNARLLSILYNSSSIFTGDGRIKLFSGLLLTKYGPALLLSWDANTRSVFLQLLVFRLLRTSRHQLQSQPPSLPADQMRVFEQDRLLLTRLETLLRTIKFQVEHKESPPQFDRHLEVYVARMQEEYNLWSTMYNEDEDEAKLHKLSIVSRAPQMKA